MSFGAFSREWCGPGTHSIRQSLFLGMDMSIYLYLYDLDLDLYLHCIQFYVLYIINVYYQCILSMYMCIQNLIVIPSYT